MNNSESNEVNYKTKEEESNFFSFLFEYTDRETQKKECSLTPYFSSSVHIRIFFLIQNDKGHFSKPFQLITMSVKILILNFFLNDESK